jgi:serine/threonine protein kinase
MEYLPGGEVYSVLKRQKTFAESQAKFYAACVTVAFEHLHRQGIIYRDLKPENLILSHTGYAKLVDMGISRCAGRYAPRVPRQPSLDARDM